MAAPKGNKYAKGHGCGRPKKWIPEEEAELLLEWVKDEDNWILRGFAAYRGYAQQTMWKLAEDNEVFNDALNIAKNIISIRRETMCNFKELDTTLYHRYASIYDYKLKAHDLEMKANAQEALGRGMATPIIIDKGSMDKAKDAKPPGQ